MCRGLQEILEKTFLPFPPEKIGCAVSGGGDSLALLLLLKDFCAKHGVDLYAATVDHGLRAESAAEARAVAKLCAEQDIAHETLKLSPLPEGGNLQSEARNGRYAALAAWANELGIETVALGHTMDDQAETLLMALSRRSGVDGLSSMQRRTLRKGITWARPLLGIRRDDLRSYLKGHGITWVEDPSNLDPRFERIRVRQALALLEPLGIDAEALGEVADHLQDARAALQWHTFLSAQELVTVRAGAFRIEARGFHLLPVEIKRRLVTGALDWINGAPSRPRKNTLSGLLDAIAQGLSGTAEGCHLRCDKGMIWIFRELRFLEGVSVRADKLWDGRWEFLPQTDEATARGLSISVLGEAGLAQCPDWREAAVPRPVLLSLPGLWRGDALQAAPLVCPSENWHPRLVRDENAFFATFLAH